MAAVKPFGTAVRVNEVPGTTVLVGPVMVAVPAVGVVVPEPRTFPALVTRVPATLAVGRSSYEYVGVNTVSVPTSGAVPVQVV